MAYHASLYLKNAMIVSSAPFPKQLEKLLVYHHASSQLIISCINWGIQVITFLLVGSLDGWVVQSGFGLAITFLRSCLLALTDPNMI